MFILIVLTVIVATVAAKPSGIITEVAYSAPAVAAVPATVSVVNQPGATHASSYRTDIVHRPPVTTYSVSAPVVAVQPIVRSTITTPVVAAAVTAPIAHTPIVRTEISNPVAAPVARDVLGLQVEPLVHTRLVPQLSRTVISTPLTSPTVSATPIAKTEVTAPFIASTLLGPTVVSRSALLTSPELNLNSHLCLNCGLNLEHTKYVLPIN